MPPPSRPLEVAFTNCTRSVVLPQLIQVFSEHDLLLIIGITYLIVLILILLQVLFALADLPDYLRCFSDKFYTSFIQPFTKFAVRMHLSVVVVRCTGRSWFCRPGRLARTTRTAGTCRPSRSTRTSGT